jgi:hypothetical protein
MSSFDLQVTAGKRAADFIAQSPPSHEVDFRYDLTIYGSSRSTPAPAYDSLFSQHSRLTVDPVGRFTQAASKAHHLPLQYKMWKRMDRGGVVFFHIHLLALLRRYFGREYI